MANLKRSAMRRVIRGAIGVLGITATIAVTSPSASAAPVKEYGTKCSIGGNSGVAAYNYANGARLVSACSQRTLDDRLIVTIVLDDPNVAASEDIELIVHNPRFFERNQLGYFVERSSAIKEPGGALKQNEDCRKVANTQHPSAICTFVGSGGGDQGIDPWIFNGVGYFTAHVGSHTIGSNSSEIKIVQTPTH
ncbi:hypothetical protein [Streptomyces sp. NPDC053431]|uniref:hypothetical protein n=1 Tax=Streptomyces sp. NPDC053431 TaxID=3365703 RepID=UPI0037D69556